MDGSKGNFLAALHEFGKYNTTSKKRSRGGGLIKVQPTAISRRKESQPRGKAPLMTGKIFKQKTVQRREHNLIKNIKLGLPNAKNIEWVLGF